VGQDEDSLTVEIVRLAGHDELETRSGLLGTVIFAEKLVSLVVASQGSRSKEVGKLIALYKFYSPWVGCFSLACWPIYSGGTARYHV